MKSYQQKEQGILTEYDILGAEIPSFWDNHWQRQSIEASLKKASSGYMGEVKFIIKEINRDDLILEAGCGNGHIVAALAGRGYKVIGIDYAESTIKQAQAFMPGLNLIYGDLREIPFPDKHFSTYISLGVIEHFYQDFKVAQIIVEAKRVTKEKLFFSVPFYSGSLQKKYRGKKLDMHTEGKYFYQFYYDKAQFEKLLRRNDLAPFKFIYYSSIIGLKRHNPFFSIFFNHSKIF